MTWEGPGWKIYRSPVLGLEFQTATAICWRQEFLPISKVSWPVRPLGQWWGGDIAVPFCTTNSNEWGSFSPTPIPTLAVVFHVFGISVKVKNLKAIVICIDEMALDMQGFFLCLFLWGQVTLNSPGYPGFPCVDQVEQDLSDILLPLPAECWDWRHIPPHPAILNFILLFVHEIGIFSVVLDVL